MATAEPSADVDERDRDVRAATERMAIVEDAPDLFRVYSGAHGKYVVDIRAPSCTCHDWQYRSESIDRCKHVARVLQTLGRRPLPDGVQVDSVLLSQREEWSE